MKEIKSILEAYQRIDFTERKAALATVVKVQGSSYRRPGARMLMTDDGRWTGAISGGCLEGDALRKARMAILDKKSSLITYDTMDDAAAAQIGLGLGCNGIIDVLIEPIDESDPNNPVRILQHIASGREVVALATVFDSAGENPGIQIGQRLLFQGDQVTYNSFQNTHFAGLLAEDVQQARDSGVSVTKTYDFPDTTVEAFIEVIKPEIKLVIFGAGYDTIPLSSMAKEMGWQVIMSDECVAHITPIRFPKADALIHSKREDILRKIEFDPYTAVVLMSHNYLYDLGVFKQLFSHELTEQLAYVGVVGPRKRYQKMIDELQKDEEVHTDVLMMNKVHSPIGLDIGAETPDEIALAIIAEVQARFTNRTGGFLKDKPGYIHKRDKEEGPSIERIYAQPQFRSCDIQVGRDL
ncbi:XdhC family protein [Rapidithrix thailandica]|uniref:XdhC family protein n=1 Tax=Rapidithrix thailandica TaxID=413964 RepID=A0AAW9SI81_9BACT